MKRLSLLVLLLTHVAFADRIFIDNPVDPIPSEIDLKTVVQLIRSAATSQGHQVVTAAAEAQAILRPSLLKLGNAYVFSLERRVHGDLAGATQLKARGAEELDEIAQRLVRAVFAEVQAAQNARPSDVTIDESTKGTRRKANRSGTIFAGGMAFLGGLGTSGGPGYYLSYGKGWAMENFTFGYAVDFAFTPESSATTAFFTDFKLEGTYYFFDNDISPFVSADFGFGLAHHAILTSWNGGMLLGTGAGVGFFRNYDIHLRVGVQAAWVVNTSLPTTPSNVALYVGIAF